MALWQMMSSMYGHRWTSAYGSEVDPDRVWQATLADVSPEQIKYGMRELARNGDDWPPSAPEFRKLCLGIVNNGEDYCAPVGIHRVFPKMIEDKTKQERAKEVGKSELNHLKSMF